MWYYEIWPTKSVVLFYCSAPRFYALKKITSLISGNVYLEIYRVNLRSQSEYGETRTWKTPNKDTCCAVKNTRTTLIDPILLCLFEDIQLITVIFRLVILNIQSCLGLPAKNLEFHQKQEMQKLTLFTFKNSKHQKVVPKDHCSYSLWQENNFDPLWMRLYKVGFITLPNI